MLSLGIVGNKDQRLTGSLQVMQVYGKDTQEDFRRLGFVILRLSEPGTGKSLESKTVLVASGIGFMSSL